MDQAKEILRLAIKYRFWIVIGTACLLIMLTRVFTSALGDQAKAATADAEGANKDVRTYASGTIPNAPYKEAVDKKTEVVARDVNKSWAKLYERQAPLLRWPESVDTQFTEWGRKWPEGVAPNVINGVIEDYIRTYPKFVESVYKTVKPFDFEEGEGIVVSPPMEVLMRPAPFDPDQPPLPSLGKVWAAQEKVWTQGIVLDVIAKVNERVGAKDWDSAAIKQINALEVANPAAQDQRSMAKGEALKKAPDINDPSKPADEAAPAAGGGGEGGGASDGGASQMMAMMGKMGGGSSSGAAATDASEVYFLETSNPDQVRVVPIFLSVLIEQSRIPDLLVEFQNSPMSIQVLEPAVMRPSSRVHKPAKGEGQNFGLGGGMGMMMSMMGGDRLMGGGRGMMEEMMSSQMGRMGAGGGSMSDMMGGGQAAMMRMMGGDGMGSAPTTPARKGQIVQKNLDRTKKKEAAKDKEKRAEKYEPRISDPYFNVVELRIYGQARFYMPPPPAEPEPEAASQSENPPADGQAEPAKDQPDADADQPKAEQPKAEQPKADSDEGKAEQPKDADQPAGKADEATKADEKAKADATPKAEPAKAEQPKDEAPKAEPAKDEPAKAEPAKDEAPKAGDAAPKR